MRSKQKMTALFFEKLYDSSKELKEEKRINRETYLSDRFNEENLKDVETSKRDEETNNLIQVKSKTLWIHANCERGLNFSGNTEI